MVYCKNFGKGHNVPPVQQQKQHNNNNKRKASAIIRVGSGNKDKNNKQ
jgi:hypothetical protein